MVFRRRLVLIVNGRGFLFQVFRGVVILVVSNARSAKEPGRKHSYPSHGADRNCASFRKALGNNSKHGWPKERFANTVNACRNNDHDAGQGVTEKGQPNSTATGAHEE